MKDKICGANLAEIQLASKYNKRISFLFCVIAINSKHAWVVCLKGKKVLHLLKLFKKAWVSLGAKQRKNWWINVVKLQ